MFISGDYKTSKNFDQEEKQKLFKTIVNTNEGLLVDDQINIDDLNPPDNKTSRLPSQKT